MEAKKKNTEAGSEATKSPFIRRAEEMADELHRMVDQEGTSRAVILVAIEDDDKGDTDSTGALGGNETQLLGLFRAMWHDKEIGRFMKMVAFYELGKFALNNGRK